MRGLKIVTAMYMHPATAVLERTPTHGSFRTQ